MPRGDRRGGRLLQLRVGVRRTRVDVGGRIPQASSALNRVEFIQRFYAGQREFQRVSFVGEDLAGVPLRDCNFARADFRGAVLSGHIENCDFSYADLRRCEAPYPMFINKSKFVNANLHGAFMVSGVPISVNEERWASC